MKHRQLVLMVEDEPEEQEIYGKLLWYNGFDVIFADNGQDGLQLARELRPDLVLLDLAMPKLDGLALCELLTANRETSSIPVVVLTGRRELAGRAREAGCAAFLEKPVSPLSVLKEIEKRIGRPPPPGDVADNGIAVDQRDERGLSIRDRSAWRSGSTPSMPRMVADPGRDDTGPGYR